MPDIPGWEGSVGPGAGQYNRPHVYARNVHSGAGNCVCGRALRGTALHVQAAPGVPIPDGALLAAIQLVRRVLATSRRDWSTDRGDALLYAIFLGWDRTGDDDEDESAMNSVAALHAWTPTFVSQLRQYQAAVDAVGGGST